MLLLEIFLGFFSLLLAIYGFIKWRQANELKAKYSIAQTQLADNQEKINSLTTQLEILQKDFSRNLLIDPLTDLPSRHVFEDRLEQVINQSARYQLTFGLLFLDIDGFKVINNALGYDAGDELLKEVAQRLRTSIRQVDTIGRFAGDEFVFILPRLSKAEAAAYVAQRFLDVIAQPFLINGQELFITASIGISIYPIDGQEGKVLLQNADNALHQAKARGLNTYQFYRAEMHALSRRELILGSNLRGNNAYQNFSLYYQKIMNTQTNKVLCMDVILKWQHPDFGLISMHEFLHLAESNGQIIAVGEWMLRTALLQLQKWKAQNLTCQQISMSVSLRQLENQHFIFRVSQILQETKMEPSCLILKISEDVLTARLDLIEKAVNMLRRLGVQIAIDEFGNGHLPFQYLKRFSVDYLKIDSGFVQDITNNKENEAIVNMVIALAKSLQITVVAQGVETAKQEQLLKKLGCNMMQGNLFGEPRLAEEVAKDSLLPGS